jgi:cyclin B
MPEVHPYIEEIQVHNRSQEHEAYIPDDFMSWHSDINASMREILIGWLLEVQPQLCLNHHSLYLGILIIDKYCHNRYISKTKYQLLGISSLFIAAKFEEVKTPRLKRYVTVCGGQYSFDQILGMESEILLALNFNIKTITSCWLLEEYLQFAGLEYENKQLCLYILDLSLVEYSFCLLRPALLSWGIILYASKARNLRELCESEIAETFHLDSAELKETLHLVSTLFTERRQGKFKTVNQKYSKQIHHIIA